MLSVTLCANTEFINTHCFILNINPVKSYLKAGRGLCCNFLLIKVLSNITNFLWYEKQKDHAKFENVNKWALSNFLDIEC